MQHLAITYYTDHHGTNWYLIAVTTLSKIHSPPAYWWWIRVRSQSICLIKAWTWCWGRLIIHSQKCLSSPCYSWCIAWSTESTRLFGWFTNSYIRSSFYASYTWASRVWVACHSSQKVATLWLFNFKLQVVSSHTARWRHSSDSPD